MNQSDYLNLVGALHAHWPCIAECYKRGLPTELDGKTVAVIEMLKSWRALGPSHGSIHLSDELRTAIEKVSNGLPVDQFSDPHIQAVADRYADWYKVAK